MSFLSKQSWQSQSHFWFEAENNCILSFLEMTYKLWKLSWKLLWNLFNQMAAGSWILSWRLSQTVGIIFISSTTCASADLLTTSGYIPFIPRVDDLNFLQPTMNKEMMNRACFFLSGVLRFENKMRWFFPPSLFLSKFSKLLTLSSTFPHSFLYILIILIWSFFLPY